MRIKGATVCPVHQKGPSPARPKHAKGARRPDAKIADKGRPIRKKEKAATNKVMTGTEGSLLAYSRLVHSILKKIAPERCYYITYDALEALRDAVEKSVFGCAMHAPKVVEVAEPEHEQGAKGDRGDADDLEAAFAELVFDSDGEDGDDRKQVGDSDGEGRDDRKHVGGSDAAEESEDETHGWMRHLLARALVHSVVRADSTLLDDRQKLHDAVRARLRDLCADHSSHEVNEAFATAYTEGVLSEDAKNRCNTPTTVETGDDLEAAFAALVFDSDSEE